MKKIYFLALFITGAINAQIVNIPDANFKAWLISIGIDTNSDGQIQFSEAQIATNFSLPANTIHDLTGIEAFTNLYMLNITNVPISFLNISGLSNLHFLDISGTQITDLNLGNLSSLQSLSIGSNDHLESAISLNGCSNLEDVHIMNSRISSLDLRGATNLNILEVLGCNLITEINLENLEHIDNPNIRNNPQLVSIRGANSSVQTISIFQNNDNIQNVDFSNCLSLTNLELVSLSLDTINLSNSISLREIRLTSNSLSTIDVSTNTALELFTLTSLNTNAVLTSLDFKTNSNLNNLSLLNCIQLSTLFIKNGINENIFLQNLPNLSFICADESQINSVRNLISSSGNNNCEVNTYCSFIPGGDYNTITGNIKYDIDNNGCDTNDFSYPYVKVNLYDGTNQGATFTDASGIYKFYTQVGNFSLTPQVENPTWFNFSPANASVNFPVVDNSVQTQNFCITPNGIHPDLEVILVPLGAARPGFDAYYKIVFKNKGNVNLSGQINLNFDDAHTDFVSANPVIDSQSVNDLYWTFSNLAPFETRSITVVLNLNSPTENPPLNAGNSLHFVAQSNFSVGESTPQDNVFEFNQTVVNSYDPNDKTCLQGNTIAATEIGKHVHYNINFENIGSSEAINVVVKDTLNTQMFDINSLQLLYASHPVETKIRDNIVEFIFRGIHLPPSNGGPIGGHGNVLFKIKTLPTLQVGDEIANTANIFFDYNHPIETNEARSAYANLSQSVFVKDESISLLPNPAKDKITVSALYALKSIEIYDAQGRLLQTIIDNNKAKNIDLSSYLKGVYLVKINTQKGSAVQKLVKE